MLANKWDVYYLKDEEEDINFDDYEIYTIFIVPDNSSLKLNQKVLTVSPGGEGWDKLSQFILNITERWEKPLPPSSYKYFIKACFQEF